MDQISDPVNVLSTEVGRSRRRNDLVFDIGMNICEDTDFYLRKGFRVVAVEANPAACASAEEQYPSEIASGQLTVLNRAISDNDAPLLFFVCKTMSAWSTASPKLRDQWAQRGAVFEDIEVPAITSADLVRDYGIPRYAKIDIEGFDLICLEGFQAAQAAPDYVSVEVDFYAIDRMLDALSKLGYRRFALVGQAGIEGQHAPETAKEGRSFPYVFNRGCSGLFGEELPNAWADRAKVRSQCSKIVRQYRLASLLARAKTLPALEDAIDRLAAQSFPLARDWYDIHASL